MKETAWPQIRFLDKDEVSRRLIKRFRRHQDALAVYLKTGQLPPLPVQISENGYGII